MCVEVWEEGNRDSPPPALVSASADIDLHVYSRKSAYDKSLFICQFLVWECRSKYPVLVANIIVEFQDVIESLVNRGTPKQVYISLPSRMDWGPG